MNLFKVKPAKTDFDESMLPSNRKEVFLDVFKLHWKSFLLLGIIVLLFCAAFIFIDVFHFLGLLNLEDNEEYLTNSVMISNIFNLIKVPCFLLLAVVLSGLIRVIRQFCWLENVTLSYDFFLGIKQNIIQVILLMIIVSVFWYLSIYFLNLSYLSEDFMKYLLVLPFGFLVFIVMPLAGYMLVSIATYSNTFLQNMKVAFIVYASNPFKAILSTILSSAIFALSFIPNIYVQLITEGVGYLLLPFILLGFFLYSNKQFDKQINEQYYPDLVNKGLRVK